MYSPFQAEWVDCSPLAEWRETSQTSVDRSANSTVALQCPVGYWQLITARYWAKVAVPSLCTRTIRLWSPAFWSRRTIHWMRELFSSFMTVPEFPDLFWSTQWHNEFDFLDATLRYGRCYTVYIDFNVFIDCWISCYIAFTVLAHWYSYILAVSRLTFLHSVSVL